MKVSKLIEELQKLEGNAEVFVSGDGYDLESAEHIKVDDDGAVLITGTPLD